MNSHCQPVLSLLIGLTLAVPFLPQTESLCGGAAAAMVFRYLGDRHADVQQFATLVDARAGGIADSVLVQAIRARGWNARRVNGSIDVIRQTIETGHPLILLIEDRPSRYHYVVAVGTAEGRVFVHDPTWGPARPMAIAELQRRWQPTGFWALLIEGRNQAVSAASTDTALSTRPGHSTTDCDRLLDAALDRIHTEGVSVADELLSAVSRQCPRASAPLRELAGVRFSQQRWDEAVALSRQALDRNDQDSYAWDVLGSSKFVLDDPAGALRAWNHIGKPKIDSVQIIGLTRTRYALVNRIAGLEPNVVLTSRQLALADRRLEELPGNVTTSVRYRPDSDGFATVDVTLLERQWPRGIVEWAALAAPAAINREVTAVVPGTTGQGEIWEANWRWWNGRPRVAASFAAPLAGKLRGTLRVDGFWEAQTYIVPAPSNTVSEVRQEQTHGGLTFSRWFAPDLRVEATSGIDVWDHALKTVPIGARIETRWLADRVAFAATATKWWPTTRGASFSAASLRISAQSATRPASFVALTDLRTDFVSVGAPLAIWAGAGEGRARPALLRAHPLLTDGTIGGPVFGRTVQAATLELQRWFSRPQLPRVGLAVFGDAAHASNRLDALAGRAFQVDIGTGVRIRVPGSTRTIRVDYAHGLRDRHAGAFTVGVLN